MEFLFCYLSKWECKKYIFVVLSHSLLLKLTQLWQLLLLRNPEMWKRSITHNTLARWQGLLRKQPTKIELIDMFRENITSWAVDLRESEAKCQWKIYPLSVWPAWYVHGCNLISTCDQVTGAQRTSTNSLPPTCCRVLVKQHCHKKIHELYKVLPILISHTCSVSV